MSIPFEQYQLYITTHPNYDFIPGEVKKKWVSVSKNGVNIRKSYWDNEHQRLIQSGKMPATSTLVNVARLIHPTKKHTCKMCNRECSIYYEYPTISTWKWLKNEFAVEKNDKNRYVTIFDIYENIENTNKFERFQQYFGKSIEELKKECHQDEYKDKKLSPGVMGNPPDRLDGFHCYNSICDCRKTNDKGRSDENMKSYTRDRRAYENYSDGNCLLANCLMGSLKTINSICFMCNNETQMSADHIGPISLGFIHDPANFQAVCAGCNSSKNNRFTQEDMNKILSKESQGIGMVSWWAKDAWEKSKHLSNTELKVILDKNAKKFLCIIDWLKINRRNILEEFVTKVYMNHTNTYTIDTICILSNGEINYTYIETTSKKKTKMKQSERTIQILLENDKKTNRKVKTMLDENEINYLCNIDTDTFKSKICKILEGL